MKLKKNNCIKGPKKKPKPTWANLSNLWPESWGPNHPIEGKIETIMKSNSWLTRSWLIICRGMELKKKVRIKKEKNK